MTTNTSDDKLIYFISDLHLDEKHQDSHQLFKHFMSDYAKNAQSLYILGDLFDYWIGDDDRSLFNDDIMACIREVHDAGVKIYFMPGNRDFLIGHWFLEKTGMRLLPDPFVLIHQHQRILLTHGDLLCRQDKAHLLFRKFSQNPLSKKIFLSRPLHKRRATAIKARALSRGNTKMHEDPISEAYARKIMHQHRAKIMIHGHTHQPAMHQHHGSHSFQRMVLGDWHSHTTLCKINNKSNLEQVLLGH